MTKANADRHDPPGQTTGNLQRPTHRVAGSPFTFDLGGEVQQLQQEVSWLDGTQNAKTLVKSERFRVVLTALREGSRIEEHHIGAPLSIQTVTGTLQVQVDGHNVNLPSGHVLVLEEGTGYMVEAHTDSSFLLTLAWPDQPAE